MYAGGHCLVPAGMKEVPALWIEGKRREGTCLLNRRRAAGGHCQHLMNQKKPVRSQRLLNRRTPTRGPSLLNRRRLFQRKQMPSQSLYATNKQKDMASIEAWKFEVSLNEVRCSIKANLCSLDLVENLWKKSLRDGGKILWYNNVVGWWYREWAYICHLEKMTQSRQRRAYRCNPK